MNTKVVLSCSVCKSRNYTTTKSGMTKSERIDVKKFCKHCNERTLHKETK